MNVKFTDNSKEVLAAMRAAAVRAPEICNCRCTMAADADIAGEEPVMRRVKNPDTGGYELVSDLSNTLNFQIRQLVDLPKEECASAIEDKLREFQEEAQKYGVKFY